MFELKQPYAMILLIGEAQDYFNDLDMRFKDIIGPAHFKDKNYFLDKHNEFFEAHCKPAIRLFENDSLRKNETQYDMIQRSISELNFLHEMYIHEIIMECDNAISHDDELNADERCSLLDAFREFKQELADRLNPMSYCEHLLQGVGKGVNANEKFNEAIEALDTDTVADFLNCRRLSRPEVLHTLTFLCRRNCMEYCTEEYKTQHTEEHAFTTLCTTMSSIICYLIDSIITDLGAAFEKRCVKNDAFNELNHVKTCLAKEAIDKCWPDFMRSLAYIEEAYDYEFTNDLVQNVYDTTIL